MARDVYYVVLHEQKWNVSYNQKYFPYKTQYEAIRASVDAAHIAGVMNPDGAQVLVQGENNQVRTEWTYGKDPYPPLDDRAAPTRRAEARPAQPFRRHERDGLARRPPAPSATPE
jgi:hypothetical protein